MPFDIAIRVESAGRVGEDRAAAFSLSDGHLLVLADGAGGTSGGAAAAEAVVARARSLAVTSALDCLRFLEELDRDLTAVGQTTAVMVALFEDHLFGASVGDSTAWLVHTDGLVDLTENQVAKPLLGSSRAKPAPFGLRHCRGRVVIGSDGLFKYVSFERVLNIARTSPLAALPDELVAAARLPSGGLQDDIAIIVAGQQAVAADGRASS